MVDWEYFFAFSILYGREAKPRLNPPSFVKKNIKSSQTVTAAFFMGLYLNQSKNKSSETSMPFPSMYLLYSDYSGPRFNYGSSQKEILDPSAG
ncbi:hypothetical protein [Flagellimonas alvinocaridis]|uniref:hypothetical protein n=1 Tax=Flagellimonas alvinocaridis TaxID=2530200 RepID=UPI00191C5137|nr:hypothetical protein [Allomuricauda alvinocaridis]